MISSVPKISRPTEGVRELYANCANFHTGGAFLVQQSDLGLPVVVYDKAPRGMTVIDYTTMVMID